MIFQLLIVVDHSLMKLSVHTGWRGSAHDARVLRNIALFVKGKNGGMNPQHLHILTQ